MSVEQYQRIVNNLDKDIAELERKKADADRKVADESNKAAHVTISKYASLITAKSKMSEIARHKMASNRAASESAVYAKKIADKRQQRNEAYLKLQKEQEREKKKEQLSIQRMQQTYERKISTMEAQLVPRHILETPISSENIEQPQYDVFISYAWEDKESFVDEFVQALKKRGLRVWYDTLEMQWGDSMRAKIDEGLRHSRFGIVVLSPAYISGEKYWTKAELAGLFQLENIHGKVLLPIWHNLNEKTLIDFSPILADRHAMSTERMTPDEITDKLIELLNGVETEGRA